MTSRNRWIVNFCRGFFVAAIFYVLYNGIFTDDYNYFSPAGWGSFWIGQFLTIATLWAILESSHWYFKQTRFGHLPAVFWALGTAFGGIDFGAGTFSLFEIQSFDKVVHFSTGILGAVLFLNLVRVVSKFYHYNTPRIVAYYIALTSVNIFGIVYEIAELIGDRYYGAHNVTGPFDTTEDILVNNIGIVLILISDFVISRIRRRRSSEQIKQAF